MIKSRNRWLLRQLLLGIAGGPIMLTASPLLAGDGFIVQPSLRKPVPQSASPAPPLQTTDSGTPAVPPAATTVTPIAPPAKRAVRELSMPQVPAARPTIAHQGVADLQWVARGTQPLPGASELSQTAVDQSLEFTNPMYQPAASQTAAATTTTASTAAAPTTISPPPASGVEESQERAVLAQLVSSRILDEAPAWDGAESIDPLSPPPGWQAVGERLTEHLTRSEDYLRRNAYFSAREEAEQAALYLMRILDQVGNSYQAEPQWQTALQALQEAEDFSAAQRLAGDNQLLRRLIESHQTDVLKTIDPREVSPWVAAQHYREFALNNLLNACQGHPWASEIFYALGRTYQAQAAADSSSKDAWQWRAVTFYRAAVDVAPSNALAGNQLGYLWLQMDRPADARAALLTSLEAGVTPAALENLAEASRRLGDGTTYQWAAQNLLALQQRQPATPALPVVTEIDPRTFIAISPYGSGPQSSASTQSASLPAATSNR